MAVALLATPAGIEVRGPGWTFPLTVSVLEVSGTRWGLQQTTEETAILTLGDRSGPGLRLRRPDVLTLEAFVPAGEDAIVARLLWERPEPVNLFRFELKLDAGHRALKNGWQSWSPAQGVDMQTWQQQEYGGVDRHASRHDPRATLSSEWFSAVSAGPARPELVLGFVTGAAQFGQVNFYGGGLVSAIAEGDGVPQVASEWLAIRFGRAQDELAGFFAQAAALGGARFPDTTEPGWCSWYYYWTSVTQADVEANLQALTGSPLQLVQIDDGWQQQIGDWEPGEKFPDGMAALAAQIREAGRTPGLWTAPFLARSDSRLAREHPDWLLRHPWGVPVVDRKHWGGDVYCLDTTHPAVLAWLEQTFARICREWGYRYIKIDFIYAAALPGVRHDPAATRVQAYRRGVEAIRRGAGDGVFVLACGAPLSATIGLAEGCRIGPDVMPAWEMDFGGGLLPACRNTMVRSAMHRRLWQSDPDCLLLRAEETALAQPQVELLTTVIGLSGGMVLDSDPWHRLPPERRALLDRLLPPGETAVPLDLMQRDVPALFALPGGEAVAVCNWGEATATFNVPLPQAEHHLYDVWARQYLGRRGGPVVPVAVPPRSGRLLSLCPAGPAAAVLYSSLHLTRRPASTWDAATGTLTILPTATASAGEVVVAPPDGRRLQGGVAAAGVAATYSEGADGLIHIALSSLQPGARLVLKF